MRKNLKEYSTTCFPGMAIYSTKCLPNINTIISVSFVNNEEAIRLKYRFYKKREEIKLFDPPVEFGNIIVRYEPYKPHMIQ